MHYEADKHSRIQPAYIEGVLSTAKDFDREIGDLEIEEITLNLLKDYLVKHSVRLKPSSLGHRVRFVRSLFRFAFEEGHISRVLQKASTTQIYAQLRGERRGELYRRYF